jgi:hypothetical protein
MHISQFVEGDKIRHSSYARGEYAVVVATDTTQGSDRMAHGSVVVDVGGQRRVIAGNIEAVDLPDAERPGQTTRANRALGDPQWLDSEWIYADERWLSAEQT